MQSKNEENKEDLIVRLRSGRNMQEMLDIAYEILGNPIVLIDLKYNLLCHTINPVTDDPIWNELVSKGCFSHETVNFFKSEHFIDAYAKSDVVSEMKSDKLKYDRADGKLFDQNGVQIGSLVIVSCNKPFKSGDFELLETVCEIISEKFQYSEFGNIERGFYENVISTLVEGKNDDSDAVRDEISRISKNLKDNIYVAVVDIMQYDHTLTHLVYFKSLFERMESKYKYFICLNTIVIIIDTDAPMLSVERDLGQLNSFFEQNRIFAGVSARFDNILELKKYYRQAMNALNYGINSNTGKRIFQYDNYRLDCHLSSIKDNLDICELRNPITDIIQSYDEKNGTSFYEILRAYFLVGWHTYAAAKMMGEEHSAFCTRLKQLGKLFEIDWSDGNVQLSLAISIKVNDCLM